LCTIESHTLCYFCLVIAAAPTPLLGEQICFALYSASRSLTSRYRELLAPLGVTYPQYLVLLVLWENGTSTVSELGRRLVLDSGTLSPLLRRLETAGLLTRSRRADDERSVAVALTPAGSDLRRCAAGIPQQICASTGLDVGELLALQAQIATLAERVRASTLPAAT
jgi:DNA-binding MarR family transcriptional regulator